MQDITLLVSTQCVQKTNCSLPQRSSAGSCAHCSCASSALTCTDGDVPVHSAGSLYQAFCSDARLCVGQAQTTAAASLAPCTIPPGQPLDILQLCNQAFVVHPCDVLQMPFCAF